MTSLTDRLGYHWERFYPLASAIVALPLGYLILPRIFGGIHHKQWALENLFVAAFTLATVAATFGLTIYTFVLTAETGFIGKVKGTQVFRSFIYYLIVASALSFLFAFMSVPGMIIKEEPAPFTPLAVYYAVWLANGAWAVTTTWRALYVFSIFSREHH